MLIQLEQHREQIQLLSLTAENTPDDSSHMLFYFMGDFQLESECDDKKPKATKKIKSLIKTFLFCSQHNLIHFLLFISYYFI